MNIIRKVECRDAVEIAKQLAMNAPTGIALLPSNFLSAETARMLEYSSSVPTIRKLWRNAGIQETPLEASGVRIGVRVQESAEWVAPLIFVGASLWVQEPNTLQIALGVISNYVTEMFKGMRRRSSPVKLTFIVQRTMTTSYTEVSFLGSEEQIPDLLGALKAIANERD